MLLYYRILRNGEIEKFFKGKQYIYNNTFNVRINSKKKKKMKLLLNFTDIYCIL